MTKEEVRRRARALELETADKPESQEICFVAGGDYKEFVAERLADAERTPGEIVHIDGTVLGSHDGIHRFTIGQRRGLGISYHEPLYVKTIRPDDGAVVVGPRGSAVARGLVAERCNWLAFERPGGPLECRVQIRHRHDAVDALLTVGADAETAFVEFAEPQRAVTPGQAAVFYRGDEVLGGGWIEEART
jgi:tRNA-specific 2-thiouridylase